jgi:hypothetical protein
MPYSIDRYSGTTIAVVEDGTINNTLDIKLIGKNYAGYGEAQNENFVWLLENFAGNSAPPRPITGQLWYDLANKRLKVYNGAGFRNASGIEVGAVEPIPVVDGELWYNTSTKQIFVYSANLDDYILVGPQRTDGYGDTVMESAVVFDINDNAHAIVKAFANGVVTSIFSSDEFELGVDPLLPANRFISGFKYVKKGVTLRNTENLEGVSTNDWKFWGTSSNADRLGGLLPDSFARADQAALFTGVAAFEDVGFTVGDNATDKLRVSILSEVPTVKSLRNQIVLATGNPTDDPLKVYVPVGISFQSGLTDNGTFQYSPRVVPTANNSVDLGSTSLRFKTIFSESFDGLSSRAQTLAVNGSTFNNGFLTGSISAAPNTVAARDASGNLTANTFIGTSSQAAGLVVSGVTIPAANFVQVNSPVFSNTTTPVVFQDVGFRFGTTNKFRVTATTDTLSFNTLNDTPLTLKGAHVLPGVTATTDLGSLTQQFRNVYAQSFVGAFQGEVTGNAATASFADVAELANKADTLLVSDNSNQYLPARVARTDFTVVVRGLNGVINADLNGNAATVTNGLYTVGDQTITGTKTFANAILGPLGTSTSPSTIFGTLTGTVNGNVTGNLTGNVTGNLTGVASSATQLVSPRTISMSGDVTWASSPFNGTGDVTGVSTLASVGTAGTYGGTGNVIQTITVDSKGRVTNVGVVAGSSITLQSVTTAGATTSIKSTFSGGIVANGIEGSGNIGTSGAKFSTVYADTFVGTATAAQYADLAEKYLTDQEYLVGTVVCIGGEKEVTAATDGDLAIGTISEKPAFMMNSELEGGQYIALKGRVPVRVLGPVRKGDKLVATGIGQARVVKTLDDRFNVFGVALETNNATQEKLVEVIVL